MKSLLFLSLIFTSFVLNAETIELKLKSDNKTCKGFSQVIIRQDKHVMYQLEVPLNGSAQAQLLTGTYQLEVADNNGCSFQDVIMVSDLPNKPIEVILDNTPRKPTSESQASLPCGWNEYGCGGNNYPHSGSIALEKPGFYFAGKDEGKFKLKLSGSNFSLLASVPNFKDGEVSGELRKGSLYIDNIWYPSLSYNARTTDDHFQNTTGLCGNKKEIYQFIIEGLKKYEFPNEARTDFIKTWSARVPEASRYCVYPQVNAQLDKTAPFEVTFEDKSQVRTERIFYLIVPQDFKGKRIPADAHKFAGSPKNVWKNFSRTIIPKTAYVFEWGLGFVFE